MMVATLFIMPFAGAINVEWEPDHPKKNQEVNVYIDGVDENHTVKLQYCIGDACFFGNMEYKNGRWIGSFKMPDANEIELSVIVDGETVWEKNITGYKEKSTPGFEVGFIVSTIFIAMLFRRRWK